MPAFNSVYGMMGRTTSWAVFILGIVYAVATILGFLSLQSPQDPIGDPFFTIMELLTILIAPLMATSMVAVHYHAAPEDRIYSLASVCFMFIMAGITSSVHFVILSAGHQMKAAGLAGFPILFSFKWPSVVYALDILAWDWFFANESLTHWAGLFLLKVHPEKVPVLAYSFPVRSWAN